MTRKMMMMMRRRRMKMRTLIALMRRL